MSINVNIEESIEGLWIAAGRYSYLASWFPILKKPSGNLFKIKPGMNVIYGLNGSGKTQLLRAIDSAAEFRMSSFEGFILKNPIIDDAGQEGVTKIFNTSADKILSYYELITSEFYRADMMLGWLKGFKPENVSEAKRMLVTDIISEFVLNQKCLLTRSLPDGKVLFDVYDRESMNNPKSVDFVPVIFPGELAPHTRAHLKELSGSFLDFQNKIDETLDGIPNLDLSDETLVEEQKSLLFESWLESWSWSPLVNLRNFGFLTNFNCDLFDGANNEEFSFLNDSSMPIFLPAIHSIAKQLEYQEFKIEEESVNHSLSLSKERGTSEEINDSGFSITDRDIDYWPRSKSISDDRKQKLDIYLSRLRQKLAFLPGLRNLGVDFEFFGERTEIPLFLESGSWLRASAGSQAERRWILLGKKAMLESTKWIVIDEPENGMHRTAEADLAEMLASEEWTGSSILVVASHSPEFLRLPNANMIHMVRGSGYSLEALERDSLIKLGIRPSDLLSGTKIFLLVEGEHEKIIFEALFREELEKLKCQIIVARGAKNMKDIFESQFIFNFTDAFVVSLLDNIKSQDIKGIWNKAKELAHVGDVKSATEYVRASLPGGKSSENIFLSQFLSLALTSGQHERVSVLGLSKPDIIFYFNPEDFSLRKSWEELLSLHSSENLSFKIWATKKFNADFSESAILNAALRNEDLPTEFGSLLFDLLQLTMKP